MDQETQDKIDELYHKVWSALDDIGSLQRAVLEIGEEMKSIVSRGVFENLPFSNTDVYCSTHNCARHICLCKANLTK